MKYGLFLLPSSSYPSIKKLALRVENLGFDSIHVPDHLISQEQKKAPWLEAFTLMTALAIETHKVKLSFIVLCNSFRNPALLAKMISTLDNISNGRTLFWLGAGWNREEYREYGYPFPNPKERVDQLEESLKIYKKLFTEDITNFKGKFWTLRRTENYPKPLQKPYPQIVLGSNGNRMIDIACREADGINLPFPYILFEDIPNRISFINEKLKKYNRDPSKFEISIMSPIKIVKTQEELEEHSQDIWKSPFVGFPEVIKEKIAVLESWGIKKIVFWLSRSNLKNRLDVFSKKIM